MLVGQLIMPNNGLAAGVVAEFKST